MTDPRTRHDQSRRERGTQEDPLAGTQYRVVRTLGQGAMGIVYLAEHVTLETKVVVKLLLPELAKFPDLVERMRVEAQALARFKSPYLLECRDFGKTAKGTPYLVTEYLDGRTLADELMARGKLPAVEAVDIATQILRGLAAAHREGIVHRDVKPANIFITRDSELRPLVKVLDFGVAKVMSRLAAVAPSAFPTAEGTILGTPRFCAPEQALGDPVDHRADLYATGLVLYYLVTGRSPYTEKKSMAEMLMTHALEAPTPPTTYETGLPVALEVLMMRSLEKAPSDRFRSADDFISALESVKADLVAVALPSAPLREADLAGPDLGEPTERDGLAITVQSAPEGRGNATLLAPPSDSLVGRTRPEQEADLDATRWVPERAGEPRSTLRMDAPVVAASGAAPEAVRARDRGGAVRSTRQRLVLLVIALLIGLAVVAFFALRSWALHR